MLTKRKSSAGAQKHHPPSVHNLLPAAEDLGNSLGGLSNSTQINSGEPGAELLDRTKFHSIPRSYMAPNSIVAAPAAGGNLFSLSSNLQMFPTAP